MQYSGKETTIRDITFTNIFLPSIKDILVIGKKGKLKAVEIKKSLDILTPDIFEFIKLDSSDIAEGMLVRKSILKKATEKIVVSDIKKYILHAMMDTELINIDYNCIVKITGIET